MIRLLMFGFVGGIFLMSFLAFDQLVSLEYRFHRADWVSDGMPHGVFWVPSEAKMLNGWLVKGRSFLSSRRCWIVWLFRSPKWARSDEGAKFAFFRWRLLVVFSDLTFLLLIGFSFFR